MIPATSLLVWNSARTRSWSPYVTIKFLVSTSCRVVKKWGWFTSRSVKSKHNVFPLKKCDQEPVRWLFWLFWVHRDSHTMPYPTHPMPYPPAPAPRSSRCRIVGNATSLVRLVRAPGQATAEIRLINVIQLKKIESKDSKESSSKNCNWGPGAWTFGKVFLSFSFRTFSFLALVNLNRTVLQKAHRNN